MVQPPCISQKVSALCDVARLDEMELPERSITIKGFLHEAAVYARDILFVEEPESCNNILIRLSSIARCVWSNDAKLANILLSSSELACEHLLVDPGGHPVLKDPIGFEEMFRKAKANHLASQRTQILRDYPSSASSPGLCFQKKTNKLQANSRGSLLWEPRAPKLVILGSSLSLDEANAAQVDSSRVSATGDVLVSAPDDHFKALQAVWTPVFSGQDVAQDEVDEFLAEYARTIHWPWHLAKPP